MASTALTPEQRTIRARIAAYTLHAQGGTSTRAGTQAFLSRFERQVVDAAAARGETLTPEETARRVRSARRAYFQKLALASSRARSNKRAAPVSETSGTAMEDDGGARRLPPAA
jgi:hypothetical protein